MRVRSGREPSEEGATIVFVVAVILLVFFGMLALSVDLGGMLVLRRKLVMATDAGSLAAAQTCAIDEDWAEASDQAADYFTDNFGSSEDESAEAPEVSMEEGVCDGTGGALRVEADATRDMSVAPILGWDETQDVGAQATAEWGPAGGSESVAPMMLNEGDDLLNCTPDEGEKVCGFWADGDSSGLSSSSHWGTMNLDEWGVSESSNCPAASADDLRDWMVTGVKLQLDGIPTFVCVDSGFTKTFWFTELTQYVGETFDFPVNRPSAMILTSGKMKFAIVAFVRMKLVDVIDGASEEAAGTPGETNPCTIEDVSLVFGETLDLDNAPCIDETPSSIGAPSLSRGKKTFKEGDKFDYTYDSITHEITWLKPPETDITVEFEWTTEASPGLCGIQEPDANAVCVRLEFTGKRVGGTNPGGGDPIPGALQAVRLKQ